MDHYVKGESRDVDEPPPLEGVTHANAVHMKVNNGTKIRNVMGYAINKLKEDDIKQLTWNASGPAVSKALSCAEIIKRKIKDLHQITRIYYKRVEDYWEPQLDGLERLCVTRNVPSIVILLSKGPLDASEPGYQPPGSFEAFWKKAISEEKKAKPKGPSKRRGGNDPKRSGDDSSQYEPPSLSRRPKKRKDGGKTGARSSSSAATSQDGSSVASPSAATPPSGSSGRKGQKMKEKRKLSGAEGKELKTAKNDSVKAQDRKKREGSGGGDDDSKMDTS